MIIALIVIALTLLGGAIFLHYVEKRYGNYLQLKQECSQLSAQAEELRQDAEHQIQAKENARHELLLIDDSIKKNVTILNDLRTTLQNEEGVLRDTLRSETITQIDGLKQTMMEELLQTAKEFSEEFVEHNAQKLAASRELASHLAELKEKETAAIKIAMEKAKENSEDWHSLILTIQELSDISHLRSVEGMLHNPEPLNKVIWKVYYEKAFTDLIGRLELSTTKATCGIYKITHKETQMCYVGQAVNIADRWRQHIKRGIGADTPTNNKLYPAMKKYGPEAFTYEVVEVCPRELLDKEEDYWQDYFGAKEFGFSIK